MENEKDKELPTGWVETKLDQICEILDSFRIPINNEERIERIKRISEDKLFPYYGATGQVGVIDEYLFDGEYILLGEDGAPFLDAFKNKAYIVNGKFWVNNHAHILKAHLSNQFVLHYLNQFGFRGYVSGTTRLKLTQLAMKEIPVPLPPLAEQHRIVAKLEELFSELDKGVENLRVAQQQLKVYRQAVLQWAFEGKLTEEWRRKNSEKLQLLRCVETVGCNEEKMELPSEWRLTNLSSVGEAIDPHPSHRTPPVVENGIPYVGIAECDYKKYAIDFDSARKVSPDVLKEHTARYLINKDDFIIGKIGTIGKPFKVPSERFFALSANVVLVQPDRILINADYVFYLFQSQVIEKQFSQGLKATTQAAFGIQKVRLMKIPYCSLPEQHQIVAEIESRLSVCDKLEETIAQSLLQAEALRQSILKQAFAGKLVPQDPSDEPVEKLLARIRAERAAANPDKIKSAKRKVK